MLALRYIIRLISSKPNSELPPRTAPRTCSGQSTANVMTTSQDITLLLDNTRPDRSHLVALGPALHYLLQHYSAIRKKSAGPNLQVIRKDRTQTNPKPTLLSVHTNGGPLVLNHFAEIGTPLPHYRLGNPIPNNHMTRGMTDQIYTST